MLAASHRHALASEGYERATIRSAWRRVYARFGAMVFMPSEVWCGSLGARKRLDGEAMFFEAISAEGGRGDSRWRGRIARLKFNR